MKFPSSGGETRGEKHAAVGSAMEARRFFERAQSEQRASNSHLT
jgi:hypothetical protein